MNRGSQRYDIQLSMCVLKQLVRQSIRTLYVGAVEDKVVQFSEVTLATRKFLDSVWHNLCPHHFTPEGSKH